MPMIDRINSGITGFDSLISGGFPRKSSILLAGACGTGKSIFSMQFLYYGAKNDETGVYITLEQKPENAIEIMKNFGWGIDELIKNKKLLVIKPEKENFASLNNCIKTAVKKIGARRLVIDSVSALSMYFKDEWEIRKNIKNLNWIIKDLDCTTLLVSDIKENLETYSLSGLAEFIVDGVVVLRIISKEAGGGHTRALFVRKMRATDHSLDVFPMRIGSAGIEVFPNLRIFEQEYRQ